MPTDHEAGRESPFAAVTAPPYPLCGVAIDSETAAWADALPSLARGLAIESEPIVCTGVAARWCPIHGDCRCRRGQDLNDDRCPRAAVSRYPVSTLRRWGISWRRVALCVVGLHSKWSPLRGECSRCGGDVLSLVDTLVSLR